MATNPQLRYQPGDKIDGRYLVHKGLLGGMGEVYLCLDLEEMYPLALKTFQQHYLTDTQRLRQAFEHEVATWVALENHPNIVRCFYMKTFDQQPFIVLEWIAGEAGKGADLRSWLRYGSLDLKLALQIAIDVCNGLLHAQTKRPDLVHRDLKPENVLMTQGGLAKLTDFGLAQMVQTAGLVLADAAAPTTHRHSLFGVKGIVGTPAYMAPEQWRGELLDARTDIYALGCILYEMLTGAAPFPVALSTTTPNRVAVWLRTLQQAHEQAPVTRLPSWLPSDLNDLVQRCLAKALSDRYPDLAVLLSHLTNLYQAAFHQPPRTIFAAAAFTASDYNNRGLTYHKLGQREAALADYTQAIHLDPTLAPAYANRGLTYHELGQREAALVDYTQAIHLDSTLAPAYINRGNIYYELGQREAALADYSQAITLDPNDASAYTNRSVTHAKLGQYASALADCIHAITLDPNYAPAYNNRGLTYHELGQREAALADYTQAIHLDPNDASAYANRGNTYNALGQREAALADYTQALTIDPTLTPVYANRGLIYHELGQREAALADYTQAIRLDPNDAKAYNNRGNTYNALGQREAALADYTQALTIDPTLTQAYANIGVLFGNQGQLAEALPYFEKAAQLGEPRAAQYAAQVRQALGPKSKR